MRRACLLTCGVLTAIAMSPLLVLALYLIADILILDENSILNKVLHKAPGYGVYDRDVPSC